MLEFKREKATLESQLRDVQKRASDHDDHLRVVDAWWTQVSPAYTRVTNLQSDTIYSCWMRLNCSQKMRFLQWMTLMVSTLHMFFDHNTDLCGRCFSHRVEL
jgi:hypothetical protein